MFAVGDEVVVESGPVRYTHHRKRVVKKLLKRYIELDDGSKWTPGGWPWGRKNHSVVYSRTRLVHWSERHDEVNLRFDVCYSFDKQKDELTLEQLKQIWLIIGPVKEQK
jgi:hypothetical protein